jgi:mannose-6-phosphate isomerase-like protein (cupin superfamily)
MYCRVLPRPKGALIVGKVHKKEHFYIVMSGAVRITNGDGAVRDVYAPAVLVCKPGTKRAVFALMDSVCATVHRTRKTTLENIEADLVEDDSRGMYLPGNVLKPKAIK